MFIENVGRLLSVDDKGLLGDILQQLKAAGYHVFFKVLNARCFGVPQNRPRAYIVGVHDDVPGAAGFAFPEDIDMMPLETLLEGEGPELVGPNDVELLALSDAARENVVEAMSRLELGPPRDWILDDRQSARYSSRKVVAPRRWSPCLVKSRGRGYWIGSRHRRLSVAEGCRLQGLRPDLVRLPEREAVMWNLLGNSMASCVVQRIVGEVPSPAAAW